MGGAFAPSPSKSVLSAFRRRRFAERAVVSCRAGAARYPGRAPRTGGRSEARNVRGVHPTTELPVLHEDGQSLHQTQTRRAPRFGGVGYIERSRHFPYTPAWSLGPTSCRPDERSRLQLCETTPSPMSLQPGCDRCNEWARRKLASLGCTREPAGNGRLIPRRPRLLRRSGVLCRAATTEVRRGRDPPRRLVLEKDKNDGPELRQEHRRRLRSAN